MTRGRLITVTNKGISVSYEKNGDMFMAGEGIGLTEEILGMKGNTAAQSAQLWFALEILKSNDQQPEFEIPFSQRTFDFEYRYPHEITIKFAPEGKYWPHEIKDGSEFKNIAGYDSDYQYIKNCTGCVLHVIDQKGMKVSLLPEDVGVFAFGMRRAKFFAENY